MKKKMQQLKTWLSLKSPKGITALALFTVLYGTVFYHIVEGFSWVDSVYFAVITLTTVGYGDLAPQTNIGKLFTVYYVLNGLGIIYAYANSLYTRQANKRNAEKSNSESNQEKE